MGLRKDGINPIFQFATEEQRGLKYHMIKLSSGLFLICLIANSFGQLVPATKVSSIANISDEIVSKAKQGLPFYQFTLGKCYLYGRGTKKDYKEAINWLEKAVAQNNSGAFNSIGFCYYYGYGVKQDYNEAVKYFRKASDFGEEYAYLNLGTCYLRGHGVNQDIKQANELFRLAEQKGLFRKETPAENENADAVEKTAPSVK